MASNLQVSLVNNRIGPHRQSECLHEALRKLADARTHARQALGALMTGETVQAIQLLAEITGDTQFSPLLFHSNSRTNAEEEQHE